MAVLGSYRIRDLYETAHVSRIVLNQPPPQLKHIHSSHPRANIHPLHVASLAHGQCPESYQPSPAVWPLESGLFVLNSFGTSPNHLAVPRGTASTRSAVAGPWLKKPELSLDPLVGDAIPLSHRLDEQVQSPIRVVQELSHDLQFRNHA